MDILTSVGMFSFFVTARKWLPISAFRIIENVILNKRGDSVTISEELKQKCIEALQTMSYREVYEKVFLPEHEGMSLNSFKGKLGRWKKSKKFADIETLERGTFQGFRPHGATVQVNAVGEVVQAWIKQTEDDGQYEELLNTIRECEKPADYVPFRGQTSARMLEIGLYDMHFGLDNDYTPILQQLIGAIQNRFYEEINIILGQDLFHNDDFRGRTAKGTPIEKVDIATAWDRARWFWYNAIQECIDHAPKVRIVYVKGNHDESLSWAFVQMLKAMFPSLEFDDSLKKRKCIYWRKCFIGVTHGDETRSKSNDMRGQFTIQFPENFAKSITREIHSGHLHRESYKDEYGIMCRRLSTANVTDDWSDDSGFVGAHKRFMVFEWEEGFLSTIHYLNKR